jgi:hypothetical protein
MLNPLSWLTRLLTLFDDTSCWREERERDPLSHPSLQRMSLEQLADLPFERGSSSMEHPDTPQVG